MMLTHFSLSKHMVLKIPRQEDNTTIVITTDEPLSTELHNERLFGLTLSPSVIISPRRDLQPPPSYEEANDPNGNLPVNGDRE